MFVFKFDLLVLTVTIIYLPYNAIHTISRISNILFFIVFSSTLCAKLIETNKSNNFKRIQLNNIYYLCADMLFMKKPLII